MSTAKSTWKVSAAVMASRVLGLARDQIFAGLFGYGVLTDAFNIAFRIPNLLRDLFAEGALSQAFVTTFTKRVKQTGPESAWPLAARMLTIIALLMSAITIVGIVFSPQLVALLTPFAKGKTFSPEDIQLTILLTRIMWPFMLLVSIAALVMGILNARGSFVVPALSSCFFNLGSIVAGTGIGLWLDPSRGPKTMIGMAIGVVIGGLGQLAFQLPALRRLGFRWRPDFNWRDSDVRKIFSLMLPAVISASVVQINVVINSQFATAIGQSAVSALAGAFRLIQLPLGVFGVTVATITLPALSLAATGSLGTEFRHTLSKGMRMVTFLVLPSSIGLCLLAGPLISTLLEHGNFTAANRVTTAAALRGYGLGLLAYSWLKVLQPAFYAADKRWIPMIASFVAICLSVASNYYFVMVRGMGVQALAATTSLVAVSNFLILYFAMSRIASGLETRSLLALLAKLLLAAIPMAAICLAADRFLFANPGSLAWWLRAIYIALTCGLAALAYFFSASLLRVPEARETLAMVSRRFK